MKITAPITNEWDQAQRYVDACKESVSGNNGSNQIFGVVCHLIQNFSPDIARQALNYYNDNKCNPRWSVKELEHKWNDASRQVSYQGQSQSIAEVSVGGFKAATNPIYQGGAAAVELLKSAFTADEYVWLGQFTLGSDGRKRVDESKAVCKVNDLIESITNGSIPMIESLHGMAIAINPFKAGATSRKAVNVSAFRHILIDMDIGNLDDQFQLLKKLQLPITAVIYSGGTGLHAWVKVDAKNEQEFKESGELLRTTLKRYPQFIKDSHLIDAPRFSRFAGFDRNGTEQSLWATNIGLPTFEAWKKHNEFPYKAHSITDYLNPALVQDDKTTELVQNHFITTQTTSMLFAPQYSGKSALSYQLAVEWSLGRSPFGLKPTKPLKSVIFQWEDVAEKVGKCVHGIKNVLQLSESDLTAVSQNVIMANRVEISSQSLTELYQMLERYITKYRPDIIWLNPITAVFDGNLSDARDVKSFRKEIDKLAVKYDCHFLLVHHTSKPFRNPKTGERANEVDLYDAFGSSMFGWWIRSALAITTTSKTPIDDPKNPRVFALKAVKGRYELDWVDKEGNNTDEWYMGHSTDGNICWIDYGQNVTKSSAVKNEEQAEQIIRLSNALPRQKENAVSRKDLANKTGINEKTLWRYLDRVPNVKAIGERNKKYFIQLEESHPFVEFDADENNG